MENGEFIHMNLSILRLGCGLIALVMPLTATAVTVVECVDGDGKTSFRDTCPPGMSVQSTRQFGRERNDDEKPSVEEVAREHPVVLYAAPNCDACDLVRNQLQSRNVPFDEKDPSDDLDIQAEVATLTGGPITVPTIAVGAMKFTGYHRNELNSALDQAGYP